MIGVRVGVPSLRRSRDFSPADIPGLALWLRADAGVLNPAGTAAINGDPVATWQDQSGNARHATQGTTARRPTLVTGVLNGRPAVRFDGVDDLLGGALSGVISTSVFAVAKFRSLPSTGGMAIYDSSDATETNRSVLLFYEVGTPSAVNLRASAAPTQAGAAFSDTANFNIWAGRVTSGAGRVLHRNGSLFASNATPTSIVATPTAYRIGHLFSNAYPGAVDTPEVLVYNSALSDANRSLVERYLGVQYALAVA